jgi:hypothetical protein
LSAALLRPEVWPFVTAYGVATWRADAALRPAVSAAAAGGIVLWLARTSSGTSGAFDAVGDARTTASPRRRPARRDSCRGGVRRRHRAAHDSGLRRRRRRARALARREPARAGHGVGLARIRRAGRRVGAGGYAGNPRYLAPATALGLVVVALGVARIARWLGRVPRARAGRGGSVRVARGAHRAGAARVAAAAICAAFAALHAGALADGVWAVDQRAAQRKSLDAAVGSAGGAAALRACGTIRTAPATRGLVAWRLGVALRDIDELPCDPECCCARGRKPGRRSSPRCPRAS